MPSHDWPPSPPGRFILGHLLEYRRDPLEFLTTCAREHGDIVHLKIANYPFFLVSHPDYVEQALIRDNNKLKKDRMLRSRSGRELFGNGLLISSGEHWRRHRHLIQPAFRADRMNGYRDIALARTAEMLSGWRDGATYDMHAEMSRLILEIAGQALFGADVVQETGHVAKALSSIADQFAARGNLWSGLRRVLPTPARFRYHQSLTNLNKIVFALIGERRRTPTNGEDLLSILLRPPADDGPPFTDQQVRDEVMTFFLAGHETTALALSWTLFLLARNPEVQKQVALEASQVSRDEEPLNGQLRQLPYSEAVLKESLRLYPPAWVLARAVVEPFNLGGFDVPVGMQIVVSQWVLHRDPRFFERPNQFDPSRWLTDSPAARSRYAYLPFGAGPRACIGQSMAMMEARLVLAAIMRRFSIALGGTEEVLPVAGITLRPQNGVPLRVHRQGVTPA